MLAREARSMTQASATTAMEKGPGLRSRIELLLERAPVRFRLAYAAWLLGVFAYFLPAATWNPVSRFSLTRALVEQHRLTIDSFADSTGDRARAGDHWYSDKAPLVAFLAAPAYTAYDVIVRSRGKPPTYEVTSTPARPTARITVNRSFQRGLYVCSLATAGLAGVGLGLVLFELLRRRVTGQAALIGATLTVLATPLFPYATSFYGHSVAALFLSSALFLLETRPARSWHARCAGACLVASVGCEYLSAVPAAALFVVALVARPRAERAKLVLDVALGGLLPAALIGGYHWACYGAPWKTGYSFIVDEQFARGHATGFLGVRLPELTALWGLSFGQRRGLFYVAPLALLACLGWLAQLRQKDWTVVAGALGFTGLLLVNSSYYMWWGGAAAAPRHLVPALGFLALGFPWLWSKVRWRWLTLAVAAVSFANMLALTAVGLEGPERGDALFDYVYNRFLAGKLAMMSGASNLGIELGLVRGGSLALLCVWLVVGAYILLRQVRELEVDARTEPELTGR
jgi:hypothetical protein